MGVDTQALHVGRRPAAGSQKQRSVKSVSIRLPLRVLEGKPCLILMKAPLMKTDLSAISRDWHRQLDTDAAKYQRDVCRKARPLSEIHSSPGVSCRN